MKGKLYDRMSRSASRLTGQNVRGLSTHYPLYDFDLRATHARTLLPAGLASVSFGFVLVRVRGIYDQCAVKDPTTKYSQPTKPQTNTSLEKILRPKNTGRHQEIKQGFLLAAQFISFSARSEYPGNVEVVEVLGNSLIEGKGSAQQF